MAAAVGVVVAAVVAVAPGEALLGIPEFLELGGCATVTLQQDFDPVKYSGLWFDIESVPNEYQIPKSCITQNYSWTGELMTVGTKGLTEAGKKVRQSAKMSVELEATSTPDPAYMTVSATGVPAAPYQIIKTDYRTYSCVYSCLEYFGFRAEFAWVFGRKPSLSDAARAKCHDALSAMNVDPLKMLPISQGMDCPYASKLEEMLQESDSHLLKVLGPYVPTTTTPAPSTTTTTTTTTAAPATTTGRTTDTSTTNTVSKTPPPPVQKVLRHNEVSLVDRDAPKTRQAPMDGGAGSSDPPSAAAPSLDPVLLLVLVTATLLLLPLI